MVLSGWMTSYGQDLQPEVPGDNFSLEGALELFKKSSSPEDFEKLLNSPDSKVNNLDLNGDGYIDYIRVHDRYQGNVHAFTLQAVVSERELQDVAVIELEKLSNGKAVLQIIGDEDVFGVETIIEPTQEVRTYAGTTSASTVVNVWAWPSVQYVYDPYYSAWDSPWGWYRRPVWWYSWRPIAYVYYYPVWRPYRHYYSYCHSYRIAYAHEMYRPYRTTSVVVYNRHHHDIDRYRSSHRDDYRDGRGRYDRERSYADNRTSNMSTNDRRGTDADRSRRTLRQPDAPAVHDRAGSDRTHPTVRPDFQRTSAERGREYSADRRSATLSTNRETRTPVTSPAENRRRSFDNPTVREQPSTLRERRADSQVHRAPSAPQRMDRSVVTERRAPSIQNTRPSRPQVSAPSVNRSRSSGSVQRSGASVQRSSTRTGGGNAGGNRRGRN